MPNAKQVNTVNFIMKLSTFNMAQASDFSFAVYITVPDFRPHSKEEVAAEITHLQNS